MKKLTSLFALCALAGLFLTGCAAQQPRRIVAGGNEAITTMGVDLQDFKNAAGQLTQAMLNNRHIADFEAKNGRMPAVNVGSIINKTDLSIDLAQIAGRINEDLLNSGLVEIVANDAGAVAASKEDAFMNNTAVNTDDRADFYMEGTINMLTASFDDMREKTYTFQIRLNNRQRRTIFQKTIDMAKQGDKASAIGW
jgi:PBP1b-binding outer membrane lipoprotein LpoB